MKNLQTLSLIALTSSSLLLSGCLKDEKKETVNFDGVAVVQTVASGESMLEFTDGISKVASRYAGKTANDYTVVARGKFFYHLGKFNIDTIQKYDIDNPSKGYYDGEGYSLRKAGETESANPYNMAFVNDSTAIITRYGSTSAWVVNLDAKNADEFLIKELDLSAQATGENDKIPEMDMVFVYKNKAFITLQNLTSWNSTGNEKVVVFNTKTWEEIDTDASKEGTQAIKLNLKNHQTGVQVDSKVYLGSLVYPAWGSSDPATGGIEVVDLNNFTTETLVSNIGVDKITATDSDKIFFTSYEEWQKNTLYKLNNDKTYSKVSDELTSKNISSLAAVEEALWLGYQDNGNVIIRLDARKDFAQAKPLAEIQLSKVTTLLKPVKIDFIKTNKEVSAL